MPVIISAVERKFECQCMCWYNHFILMLLNLKHPQTQIVYVDGEHSSTNKMDFKHLHHSSSMIAILLQISSSEIHGRSSSIDDRKKMINGA